MHFVTKVILFILLALLANIPPFRLPSLASFADYRHHHQAHFHDQGRSVIVELLDWKYLDVADECRIFLGPKGYAGVQIAKLPLDLSTVSIGHSGKSSSVYRFSSRAGNETDFWTMSRICNEAGVRVYADVNLHQMSTITLQQLLSLNNSLLHRLPFWCPSLFCPPCFGPFTSDQDTLNCPLTLQHFHAPCSRFNPLDAQDIRNCNPSGHPVLNYGHLAVRKRVIVLLNHFIKMGIAGFRIEAAKKLWPKDLEFILSNLDDLNEDFGFPANSKVFIYQDVLDLGLDGVSRTEYVVNGLVSEYLYPINLAAILRGYFPITRLMNWGPALGFVSSEDAVVFIDSSNFVQYENELKNSFGKFLFHLRPEMHVKYVMATAFMLVHPYGHLKRLMSSYRQFPPTKTINQNPYSSFRLSTAMSSPSFDENGQCLSSTGFICEHRWPIFTNLIVLANNFQQLGQMEGQSIDHFQTHGPNQIAFCRGQHAFVAMNNDLRTSFNMTVYTCLPPGSYCDVMTGGLKDTADQCNGRSLLVDAEGYGQLELPMPDETHFAHFRYPGSQNQSTLKELSEINYGIFIIYRRSKIKNSNHTGK